MLGDQHTHCFAPDAIVHIVFSACGAQPGCESKTGSEEEAAVATVKTTADAVRVISGAFLQFLNQYTLCPRVQQRGIVQSHKVDHVRTRAFRVSGRLCGGREVVGKGASLCANICMNIAVDICVTAERVRTKIVVRALGPAAC